VYDDCVIRVEDKAKRQFLIDLNNVELLLQQKAKPLNKVLKEYAKNGDKENVKLVIRSYIDLCHSRAKKDIWNRDYCNYFRNIGWDSIRAVEIDVGSFYQNDPPNTYSEEMDRCCDMLYKFVKEEIPQYTNIAEEVITEIFLTKQNVY
jgi:hypothetical protein